MSLRYKGAVISATPPTTTGGESGVASGSWTLEQQFQAQGAGNWPTPATGPWIEDCFSTYLYTGNGGAQTITNGIDLAGKGGLVWLKARNYTQSHGLFDTARGENPYLDTDLTSAQFDAGNGVVYNSNGFTNKATSYFGGSGDGSGYNYVSWTFRKQPKFFDVVTYTGNGATTRNISHNLGSTPGFILVKCTSTTGSWAGYHRSLGATYVVLLNSTSAAIAGTPIWDSTEPTSTQFTVNDNSFVNTNGATYVAYLFAHNAGGFGLTGTDNVISCGSFTTGASGITTVDLGYEPQYLLFKTSSTTGDWIDLDNMRGFSMTQNNILSPNTSAAEDAWGDGYVKPTATGFTADSSWIGTSRTFIYIAIRRGPMKVPTDATKVFAPTIVPTAYSTSAAGPTPTDMSMLRPSYNGSNNWRAVDRLRGNDLILMPNQTNAESSESFYKFDTQSGLRLTSWPVDNSVFYNFKRAPSFFDEVCFTNTSYPQNVTHNLAAVPEMVIVKGRNTDGTTVDSNWCVWTTGNGSGEIQFFNSTLGVGAYGVISVPTNTTTVPLYLDSATGKTFVMYLFATVAGVSKVGSYTGTGTTKQIDCGFTGGARFVLIKRKDSTGDWYVWDSARGIVAGNDPYLLLNSTAAEVTNTDYVDTYSAGFEISSTAPAAINASGGTFIFLAIA